MEPDEELFKERDEKGEVQFILKFDEMMRSPILSGADFSLRIEVKNESGREIEIPEGGATQPQYHVRRPDGNLVTFFQMGEPEPGEPPEPPDLVRILPGESWSRSVPLLPWFVDITLPGRYEVRATLDWNGIHAEAAPISFEVLPARFEGIAVSHGREQDIVLLQRREDGRLEEVEANYMERIPEWGPDQVYNPRTRGPLPEDTLSVLVPYINYDSLYLYTFSWVLARVSRGIYVGHDAGSGTTIIIPHYKLLDVLTPLAIGNPSLLFFAILRDGKGFYHLAFARLDHPVNSKRYPIPEAIPKTLPFKTILEIDDYSASAAALGPERLGSSVIVALALRSEDLSGAEILLMKVSHQGEIEAKKTVEIPGLTPLKEMAACINKDGEMKIVLLAKEKKGGAIKLVELQGTHDLDVTKDLRVLSVIDSLETSALLTLRLVEHPKGGIFKILLIRRPQKKTMVFDGEEKLRPAREDLPYDCPVEPLLISGSWNILIMHPSRVEVAMWI